MCIPCFLFLGFLRDSDGPGAGKPKGGDIFYLEYMYSLYLCIRTTHKLHRPSSKGTKLVTTFESNKSNYHHICGCSHDDESLHLVSVSVTHT